MVTFQLPAGPKNLKDLFPGVDFSQVEEYFIELRDPADNSALATTNVYKRGCCCNEDTIRIFFVNYLGGIDSIGMKLLTKETEVKSTRWKKPLQYPLQKWDGGWQRSNITGQKNLVAETTCYTEADMDYLEELKATPNAWMQWTGMQGQPDDYIPIIIEDGKFVTRKSEERYSYPFQLSFSLSNEIFTVRN